MPLTFAHPAAVLPGLRWHGKLLPFPALVIGSMSPDFEYFLRLEPIGHFGHRGLGILLFCLPVGLIVYALYTRLIAPVLPTLLPPVLACRLPEASDAGAHGPWGWIGPAIAVIIGATTHVVWDSFTHSNGAMVTRVPILQEMFFGVPLYKFAQHGSTILGLAAILWWLQARPVCRPRMASWPYVTLGSIFFVFALVALSVFALICPPDSLGLGVVSTIDAGIFGLLACCVWAAARDRCREV